MRRRQGPGSREEPLLSDGYPMLSTFLGYPNDLTRMKQSDTMQCSCCEHLPACYVKWPILSCRMHQSTVHRLKEADHHPVVPQYLARNGLTVQRNDSPTGEFHSTGEALSIKDVSQSNHRRAMYFHGRWLHSKCSTEPIHSPTV